MGEAYRILDELTRVSIKILLKEPFYSHIFACLNKEVVHPEHRLKTLAVGQKDFNHVIYINQDFWDKSLLLPQHRYGVVKHEILHIVLKHTLANLNGKDARLANIAMDLVVNQYILVANLPEESIFLSTFPELNLEAEKSWGYYYSELMKLQNNLNNAFDDTVAMENLSGISSDSHGLERHILWDDFKKLTSANQTLTENILDNLLILGKTKTSPKSYGTLPGQVKELLESLSFREEPLVDWKRVLKLFSESSAKTRIKNTLRRRSKRYGTFPGIKVQKLKKLLVAIDTSGSVSNFEIAKFFGEIYHIWKNGAHIKVIECDTTIKKTYDYKGIAPDFIHGRGGTDFEAPIIFANKKYLPDAIVYFTDGYAPIPVTRSRSPILWIFTKNGVGPGDNSFNNFPGRKAKF